MMIQMVVVLLFLIGFIWAKKKGYKGDPFHKIARFLTEIFYKIRKGKKENREIRENLNLIYPNESNENKVKEFQVDCLKIILIIVFAGTLLSLFIHITSHGESAIINNYFMERNTYGEGKKKETIIAQIEGEQIEKKIEVILSEQQFTEAEIDRVFQETKGKVEQEFLGQNKSLDEINQAVNLVNTTKEELIDVEWEIRPFGLVDYSGEIQKKNISLGGELGKVTAHLKYFEYEYYHTFYIRVFPKIHRNEEDIEQKLKAKIDETEKATRSKSRLELPQTINNQTVKWKSEKQFKSFWILLLTIVVSVGFSFKKKIDLKKQVKNREQQMLIDYSKVVSKLLLLLGAGMPVSLAWKRVALDYKKQRQENKMPLRYIYEEMLLTYYEMSDGIPEIEAFERFGRRCRVQKYLKLSGILIQNIRQGTKEIKRLLQYEMKNAMEERKNIAKKLGEEAGTKLLGPMMMLLIVVLMMIAVPAFLAL